MNSSVTIVLAGSFERAQAAVVAAQAAEASSRAQVYAAAQKACSGKSDSVSQAKCNSDFLASRASSIVSASNVPVPQPADYQYKFTSPSWTFDLAGILLMAGGVMLVLFILIVLNQKKRV